MFQAGIVLAGRHGRGDTSIVGADRSRYLHQHSGLPGFGHDPIDKGLRGAAGSG